MWQTYEYKLSIIKTACGKKIQSYYLLNKIKLFSASIMSK